MDEYINKTKFEELMRKKARSNFDLYYADKSQHYHANAVGYSIAADEAHVFPSADVQLVDDTENMATISDEFICKKCGIYLKDYIKVVMDEDNDGYIDEQHYDYEPKFCPECGAKVESCIKTPKRDKPLYTMDEICKMNGVEFKGGEQNDKTQNV